MSIAFFAVSCISSAVLVAVLINLLFNLCVVRQLKPGPSDPVCPFVSILVPARNEAHRIGSCLISLLEQAYPNFEVLVLDDHSSDETSARVLDLGFSRDSDSRFVLLTGKTLAPGWTGKSWACQQLAEQAKGECLLFTDADTWHHPGLLAAVVKEARRTQAGLLTLWPDQVTGTLAEKLVIPLLFVAAAGFVPHWLLEYCQRNRRLATMFGRSFLRHLGTANGQFLFFQRECYQAVGGHRAVANHLVEDVGLGRLVAERTKDGLRLISRDGTRLIRCRMYTSFAEVWEGFSKNLRPVFEGDSTAFFVSIVVQGLVAVGPFLGGAFWPRPITLLPLVLILAIRALTAKRFRSSWLSVLLHPAGYLMGLAIALNSWRRVAGPGVTWKGRLYQRSNEGDKKSVPTFY
jgi:chlorobactene glucosyltransferase